MKRYLSDVEIPLCVKGGERVRDCNSFSEISDIRILHLFDRCLDYDLHFLFKEKHNISETRSVTVLR